MFFDHNMVSTSRKITQNNPFRRLLGTGLPSGGKCHQAESRVIQVKIVILIGGRPTVPGQIHLIGSPVMLDIIGVISRREFMPSIAIRIRKESLIMTFCRITRGIDPENPAGPSIIGDITYKTGSISEICIRPEP